MGTADYMSERERQDLRDAGRGHLIDGGRAAALIDKADDLKVSEREDAVNAERVMSHEEAAATIASLERCPRCQIISSSYRDGKCSSCGETK